MRVVVIFIVVTSLSHVLGKTNVKSLTESNGQEIIELGAPIKDLPPGLDEEPAPDDDDDKPPATILVATRKEIKKTTTTLVTKSQTPEVVDDEEARIEKELAAIYKDNDYKTEGSEEKIDKSNENNDTEDKLIARQQTSNNFKFQPNSNKKQDIEAFRTSVDDIDCGKVTQMLMVEQTSDGELIAANYTVLKSCILLLTCIPYM